MTRPDIAAAIQKTPNHVRDQIERSGKASLELLEAYLPETEKVDQIASAAPEWMGVKELHCLLVLTDRRLLFIAPAPQALSWRLSTLTKVQALDGVAGGAKAFFVESSDGGSYQLGADGAWGREFAPHVKLAVTRAVLEGH